MSRSGPGAGHKKKARGPTVPGLLSGSRKRITPAPSSGSPGRSTTVRNRNHAAESAGLLDRFLVTFFSSSRSSGSGEPLGRKSHRSDHANPTHRPDCDRVVRQKLNALAASARMNAWA
jgi:hypothetical protein